MKLITEKDLMRISNTSNRVTDYSCHFPSLVPLEPSSRVRDNPFPYSLIRGLKKKYEISGKAKKELGNSIFDFEEKERKKGSKPRYLYRIGNRLLSFAINVKGN